MRSNDMPRKDGELNMWIYFNANPRNLNTTDCPIRAICAVSGLSWYEIHDWLCEISRKFCMMPNDNPVIWKLLRELGFTKHNMLPQYVESCYTVADFAHDHPYGKYVLGPHEHAVAVIDGNWWDTFDSGGTVPLYYFCREEDER